MAGIAEEAGMARRKRRRKRASSAPAAAATAAAPGRKRRRVAVIIAIAAAAVGGIAWWGVTVSGSKAEFLALAAEGQAALSRVRTMRYEGTGHLSPGQSAHYRGDPPTSGAHDRDWIAPGFYDAPQFLSRLVHALEHGNVVIYYDRPDPATRATLEEWTGLFRGQWSGLVMTPGAGLGTTIVLTAWRRTLRLKQFDAAAAAAFIDRYRGRGPENAVR